MGAVGVGQVGGHENLVRLDAGDELLYGQNVALRHGQFLHPSRLIEGQVEEVDVVGADTVVGACKACLATADEAFEGEEGLAVVVAAFLLVDELLDGLVTLADDLVAATGEQLVKAIDEVHEPRHLLVVHGDVAARLVGDVHVVSLLHESAYRATHRDDIVVGVG